MYLHSLAPLMWVNWFDVRSEVTLLCKLLPTDTAGILLSQVFWLPVFLESTFPCSMIISLITLHTHTLSLYGLSTDVSLDLHCKLLKNHTAHKDVFCHGGLTADVSTDRRIVWSVYHSQCRNISVPNVLTIRAYWDFPSVLHDNHTNLRKIWTFCFECVWSEQQLGYWCGKVEV